MKKKYIVCASIGLILLFLLCGVILYLFNVGKMHVPKKGNFQEVSLTYYQDGEDSYTLQVDTEQWIFKLQGKNNQESIICPAQYIPLKVVTINEEKFIFCKKMFNEAMCLLEFSDDVCRKIKMPEKFGEFIFRDAVFFDDRLESSLFFVAYNTETGMNQLFKFAVGTDEKLTFCDAFSIDLNFGDNNVDENVKMIASEGCNDFGGNKGLFIMGTQYYYTYQVWMPFTLNRYSYEGDARLAEVYVHGKDKYFLTQNGANSEMLLYNINDRSFRKELQLNEEILTGTIETDNGEVCIKEVKRDQLIDILRKDITSLQCGGLIEMGSNNLEGRVPWAQTYYLNGFIDFLMPEFTESIKSEDFVEYQAEVEDRLEIEIGLLEQLVLSEQGPVSKRYHMDREAHVSALHCERILQVFNRYDNIAGEVDDDAYTRLANWGLKYEDTIEKDVVAGKDDVNGVAEGKQYLLTGEGGLFKDTVAPYNYMSAYVATVFSDRILSNKVDIEFAERAEDFISILLEDERFLDFDSEYDWPYFYGEPYSGWDKKYENNIPCFQGQQYKADISYRSMDAMAIIYAMKAVPELYKEEVIDYLRTGVETGKLFPFVNEALVECEYAMAEISFEESKKWIRVHHSWNIQNAAWIYYFLLQEE